jgi:hypothetical protein
MESVRARGTSNKSREWIARSIKEVFLVESDLMCNYTDVRAHLAIVRITRAHTIAETAHKENCRPNESSSPSSMSSSSSAPRV